MFWHRKVEKIASETGGHLSTGKSAHSAQSSTVCGETRHETMVDKEVKRLRVERGGVNGDIGE